MTKTFDLPGTDITAPKVVLGLMRVQDKTDDDGSGLHGCERRFAEAMALRPADREKLTIQTKAGIVPDGPYFDFSYEHIIDSVNGSLEGALPGSRVHGSVIATVQMP